MNELLLLSGSDIPFPEARVTIHQPTLKEIGYIGEKTFFIGCGFLDFSRDLLDNSDKSRLANYDDFNILMSIMINNDQSVRSVTEAAMSVLSLIFPLYEVKVRKDKVAIILIKDEQEFLINEKNFIKFKEILEKMFNLSATEKQKNYDPQGSMAKRIADKFKQRHAYLDKLKKTSTDKDNEISVLNRYASILAVGLQKDLNALMKYTVYQLYDEFQRFQLKVQWDAYVQARMAGAKDLEEVDNWMINLKDQKKNKK